MTKKSGLGAQFYVGGYDLSNDTGSVNNLGSPRGVLDVTGMNKEAYERLLSHKDGIVDWSSWFNPASDQAHEALSALPTADSLITFAQNDAIGDVAGNLVARQINYDGTRTPDAGFSFGVNALGDLYGMEWGQLLTAGLRTDTGATNGAGLESLSGASTAFGLQAYCHLMEFTGTSVTIKLQGDDNSGFTSATDVTDGSFGALSTPRTWHRLATANDQTIERYLRVATTGTFSHAVFVVAVIRNEHAGVTF